MADLLAANSLVWLAVLASTSPLWLGIGWEIWQGEIRPRLIPRAEIDGYAKNFIARYGQHALAVIAIEMDRAWRYGETREAGRLRRVHKAIEDMIAVSQPPVRPEHVVHALDYRFKTGKDGRNPD